MTTWPALSGCRIQRIDSPAEDLLTITLGRRDLRTTLVVVLSGAGAGVGLCEQRPRGRAADAFVQRLRKHLGGARVELAGVPMPGAVRLSVSTRDGPRAIDFTLRRDAGNVVVSGPDGGVLFGLRPLDDPDDDARSPVEIPGDLEQLRAAGPGLVETHGQRALGDEQRPLERAIARRIKSLGRRLSAIEGDARRADDVGRLRADAALLLSHLHAIDANADEATVVDHADGEAREVTLRFERGLGPKQQAEAWFKRARRMERGAAIAADRRNQTLETIASLEALRAEVRAVDEAPQLDALRERARSLGIGREASAGGGSRQPATRRAYREYMSADGHAVLVGRGARDNDELTVKVARPHDLFLHARGTAGAHVIVRLDRGETCPSEVLVDAATLAAHFSGQRGDTVAEVAYTPRRHVRKPRGSAAGSVTVQSERVLQLRSEPERLARLLASIKA